MRLLVWGYQDFGSGWQQHRATVPMMYPPDGRGFQRDGFAQDDVILHRAGCHATAISSVSGFVLAISGRPPGNPRACSGCIYHVCRSTARQRAVTLIGLTGRPLVLSIARRVHAARVLRIVACGTPLSAQRYDPPGDRVHDGPARPDQGLLRAARIRARRMRSTRARRGASRASMRSGGSTLAAMERQSMSLKFCGFPWLK